jgi:hypothetical protein
VAPLSCLDDTRGVRATTCSAPVVSSTRVCVSHGVHHAPWRPPRTSGVHPRAPSVAAGVVSCALEEHGEESEHAALFQGIPYRAARLPVQPALRCRRLRHQIQTGVLRSVVHIRYSGELSALTLLVMASARISITPPLPWLAYLEHATVVCALYARTELGSAHAPCTMACMHYAPWRVPWYGVGEV